MWDRIAAVVLFAAFAADCAVLTLRNVHMLQLDPLPPGAVWALDEGPPTGAVAHLRLAADRPGGGSGPATQGDGLDGAGRRVQGCLLPI